MVNHQDQVAFELYCHSTGNAVKFNSPAFCYHSALIPVYPSVAPKYDHQRDKEAKRYQIYDVRPGAEVLGIPIRMAAYS